MNQFVPDWNNMGDTSRPLGEDDDLMELLWCNGHVVMQSQTHRKVPPRPDKAAAVVPPPPAPAPVPQEDEGGLWFPFALADSLDKDIFSDFFYEAPAAVAAAATPVAPVAPSGSATEAAAAGKSRRDEVPAEADRRGACPVVSEDPCDLMPPPKSTPASCSRQQTLSLANGGGDNAGDLSDFVVVPSGSAGKAAAGAAAAEPGGASSMLSTIGSSICGSNQVLVQRAVGAPGRASGSGSGTARGGGSGSANYCFGTATTTTTTTTEPTSTSNRSSKRKRLDTEDSESPSEDAESESAAMLARKKMTTARRNRAAEVHNLSERRRRDRINEKMRALQELIPHCNKTDKASMLDEAIEYLKSLQLQVQMMWMGGGIAAAPPAVMFPGVHQYLPRMGVGMGPAAAMPSMPRLPPFMAAPQAVVPTNAQVNVNVNPVPGYRGHHMPAAVGITEPYGHYLGVNHLQPPPSQVHQHYAQGVGYYPPLGAKAVQQQTPELHHVPGPGGSMPSGAGAGAAPGVLPPESAPSRGPG